MYYFTALFILVLFSISGCSGLNILKSQDAAEKYLKLSNNESGRAYTKIIRIWYTNNERSKHYIDEINISSDSAEVIHNEYGKKRCLHFFVYNFKRSKSCFLDEYQCNELLSYTNFTSDYKDSIQVRSIDSDKILTTGGVTYVLFEVFQNGTHFQSSCRYGIDCNDDVKKLMDFVRSNFWK